MVTTPGERVTMTFLFTDIEGSTGIWERHPAEAPSIIEHHDDLVQAAVATNGGEIFHRAGDGMIARFTDVDAAILAAVAAQRSLEDADWGDAGPIRVRMGVHAGSVVVRPEGPYGWALNFGARMTDLGHGGQILLSSSSADSLALDRIAGAELVELGDVELRDIPRRVSLFALRVPGLPATSQSVRVEPPPVSRVPVRTASFVGRNSDVSTVLGHLHRSRVVTITGTSGIGKTRLAIEVVADDMDGPAPALLWCDLSGIDSGSAIASIMTSHGIALRPGRNAIESLVEYLSERPALVVLDGCDEALDAVAQLLEVTGALASPTRFLCTTQHVIGASGEVVHRLAPLAIDDAVKLFGDRGTDAGTDPGSFDGTVVAEVCERVDGLPFAIELAASATSTFALSELRDLLRSGGLAAVTTDEQVAALERTVAVAVGSLAPIDRDRLTTAAVFAGRFDREMFAAICAPDVSSGDVSRSLRALVDASLLQPEAHDDRTTFRLLEQVRSHVLSEADAEVIAAGRRRLGTYVAVTSGRVAQGLRTNEELSLHRTIVRQFDSWRAVFDDALDRGDVVLATQLATDNWEWAFFRYNSEYFDWGRRVLERFGASADPLLGPVHGVVALGHWFRDELDQTLHHGQLAVDLERERGAGFSLPARLAMINASVFAGAAAPPAQVFDEATKYHLARPEGFYRMNVEAQNAIMATWLGQYELGEARATKALRIARASDNPTSVAYGLWVLGQSIEHEDPERAEHLLGDAVLTARRVDNLWVVTLSETALASIRRRTAGPEAAAPLLASLLDQLERAGHWAQVWNVIRIAALVVADDGNDELALQLATAVDSAVLTFPGLPVDVEAVDTMRESIVRERGASWCGRAARLASTWNMATVISEARSGLGVLLESA